MAVDLVNRRVLRLPRSEGVAGTLSVSGSRLAAIVMGNERSALRVYRIPAPAPGQGAVSAALTVR